MPLELIGWNPRKKRRKSRKARSSKKSSGRTARARTRKRKAARRRYAPKPGANKGGPIMAKKKRRRRRGFARRSSAHTSPPPSGRRRRRHFGGGGGGGKFSLRQAFNLGAIVEGTIVGAAVSVSGIATNRLVAKFKPDLALNPWLMSRSSSASSARSVSAWSRACASTPPTG